MTDENEKYISLLNQAWKDRRLVVFLGAGVSASRGIPTWNQLVVDLIVENTDRFADLWPNYRGAVGDWLNEDLDFTPITLTSAFKYSKAKKSAMLNRHEQMAYLQAIRKALYRDRHSVALPAAHGSKSPQAVDSDTLSAVVALLARSERNGRRVPTVITTNFDDLLERELDLLPDIKYRAVHDGAELIADQMLPILHVHGYIPASKAIPLQEIVFAEDEYNGLTYNMFHWALVELLHCLRGSTVLFIGFGMTDPNIRRLLGAVHDRRPKVRHVVIRKDSLALAAPGVIEQAIGQRAARYDPTKVKTPPQLAEDVGKAVRQAKSFDQQLLKRLGVGVVSVSSFNDIAGILDRIGGSA